MNQRLAYEVAIRELANSAREFARAIHVAGRAARAYDGPIEDSTVAVLVQEMRLLLGAALYEHPGIAQILTVKDTPRTESQNGVAA